MRDFRQQDHHEVVLLYVLLNNIPKTSQEGFFCLYLNYMNIISLLSVRQKNHRGFTVLEFLIVLAIIIILIAILLPNLQKARQKSDDERLVSDLKAFALGLEQYKQVCGSYPAKIERDSTCDNMRNSGSNLGNFITNIDKYKFNTASSKYKYFPIAYNNSKPDECDGFHLGVELSSPVSGNIAGGDQDFDSTDDTSSKACNSNTSFNGTDPKVFDMIQ